MPEGAGDRQDSVEKYSGPVQDLQRGSGSSLRFEHEHSAGLPQCYDRICSRRRLHQSWGIPEGVCALPPVLGRERRLWHPAQPLTHQQAIGLGPW